MKLLNSPFSLLPSQFLGMKSLIRYGLDSAGLADTFVLILFNMSILPLIASFTSALSCCISSATSCLNSCCNDAKCAGVTMSACCSAVAAATAAAAAIAVLGLGVARAVPLVASLDDAPLPCQMQPYFVARLEPTRMRWEDGQVHTTSLETRKANVQECNGVKSTCNSTLPLSLGYLCAQADCDTHCCWKKSCIPVLHRAITNLLERVRVIERHDTAS